VRVVPLVFILVLASGCIIVRNASTRPLNVQATGSRAPRGVRSPAKAHLMDGSVVVLPEGFRIRSDSLVGPGTQFDATLSASSVFAAVPLDSVAGVEVFVEGVDPGATMGWSILATTVATFGFVGLAIGLSGGIGGGIGGGFSF